MERYSAGKGGENKAMNTQACLSSLNSSQNKAGKVDKAAKRRKLVGEKRRRFFFSDSSKDLPPFYRKPWGRR